MKKISALESGIGANIIKMVEKEYDWSGKSGAILLKETKALILAYESLNYTEKQIISSLKENGNI